MGKNIKAIIFDCFGVLTSDRWQDFLKGLPASADINKARAIHRDYNAGLISKNQCAEQIRAATGNDFIEVEDLLDEQVNKNTQLLEYIKVLRDRGYKISILSNASTDWVRQNLLNDQEVSLFDDFVLSYTIGLVKPDRHLFLLAADRLGMRPDEIVFIDDKPTYCFAAEELKFNAVCYRNFDQFKVDIEGVLQFANS